jgi:hypothetical protein
MADKNSFADIEDSKRDQKRLQPDEATLDLPDVNDIPGQENIHVPDLKEMADTTASSDDEEGIGIWNNDALNEDLSTDTIGAAQQITENDLSINDRRKLESNLDKEDIDDKETTDANIDITDDSVDPESDVRPDEKEVLERSADNIDTPDNEDLFRSELDDTDFDGEKLNEDIELSGDDLDVPGAELDDDNEEIGEEDEENNAYSLGDTE